MAKAQCRRKEERKRRKKYGREEREVSRLGEKGIEHGRFEIRGVEGHL